MRTKVKFPKVSVEPNTKDKIMYLVRTGKARTMTEMKRILKKSDSTLSQHLSEMAKAKLIGFEQKGKCKVYSVRKKNARKKRRK